MVFGHFARCLMLVGACSTCSMSAFGQSYTPDHPKVQAMVDRGVEFLSGDAAYSQYGDGEAVLVGYALFKALGDPEHPKVKSAAVSAESIIQSLPSQRGGETRIVYEAAMAAVLLASLDAGKYQGRLQEVLTWLQYNQKDHGGFGYLGKPTGDTSQVQYVMLALWTMNEAGVQVPSEMVERTLRYLKATIDPSGGWGYQGVLGVGKVVPQVGVTKSLATAGLGALIIGGDILKFYGDRRLQVEIDDGIPKAFVRLDIKKKLRDERRDITMSRSDIEGAVTHGVRYQNRTPFTGTMWYYYWRYSQERYESFLEIVENRQNESPDWYNAGVDELSERQGADGSWGGGTGAARDPAPPTVNTSFALLFLIRSTQRAIGHLDEGVTFGGYGLPQDISSVKMFGDRIVSEAEASVENLLEMLESEEAADVQLGLLPDDLQLSSVPAKRKEQTARLSRLLVSGDYRARRVAAKLLGRGEDLSLAPDLIYALTDDDPHVPMIAEESLRLLSRKLTAGSLGLAPTPAERAAAEKFWKAWYLGLRPDYIFLDR